MDTDKQRRGRGGYRGRGGRGDRGGDRGGYRGRGGRGGWRESRPAVKEDISSPSRPSVPSDPSGPSRPSRPSQPKYNQSRKQRRSRKAEPEPLPIMKHIDEICEKIKSSGCTADKMNHCVIMSDTGSGKSTVIPGELSQRFGFRVMVAVPRIVAAITLCEYSRTLFPKLKFGYGANGDINYTPETNVIYATAGHVARKMFSYFKDGKLCADIRSLCDVLIIDEMHTGSLDNTVISSLITEVWKQKGPDTPLVVALSATPIDDLFPSDPVEVLLPGCNKFPVTMKYVPINRFSYGAMSQKTINNIYSAVMSVMKDVSQNNDGDILIFAHGKGPVMDLCEQISNLYPDYTVLPAYSDLNYDELEKIKEIYDNRLVVVATNIAETSITLPRLSVVIDTLLENRAFTCPTNGHLALEVSDVSYDSVLQRRGRVGRTRPGTYYAICDEHFLSKLERHTELEIKRVPIIDTCLRFMVHGFNPSKCINGIGNSRLKTTMRMIKTLKLVEKMENKDRITLDERFRLMQENYSEYKEMIKKEQENKFSRKLTKRGIFVSNSVLGARFSSFLHEWILQEYDLYYGIIIACILDSYGEGGFFVYPHRRNKEKTDEYEARIEYHVENTYSKYIGETQIHTALRVWKEFTESLDDPKEELHEFLSGGNISEKFYTSINQTIRKLKLNHKRMQSLFRMINLVFNEFNNEVEIRYEKEVDDYGDVAVKILSDIFNDQAASRYIDKKYVFRNAYDVRPILSKRYPISGMELGKHFRDIFAIQMISISGRDFITVSIPDDTESSKTDISSDDSV